MASMSPSCENLSILMAELLHKNSRVVGRSVGQPGADDDDGSLLEDTGKHLLRVRIRAHAVPLCRVPQAGDRVAGPDREIPPSGIQIQRRTSRWMRIQRQLQLHLREAEHFESYRRADGQLPAVARKEHLVGLVRLLVCMHDSLLVDADDSQEVDLVADDDVLCVGAPSEVQRAVGHGHSGDGFAGPNVPDAQGFVFRDGRQALRIERVPDERDNTAGMASKGRRGFVVTAVWLPDPDGRVVASAVLQSTHTYIFQH